MARGAAVKMGVRALPSCSPWVERLPQAFLLFWKLPTSIFTHKDLAARGLANFSYLLLLLPSLPPAFHPAQTLAPLDNLAWHPHPTQGILGGFFSPLCFPFILCTQTPSSRRYAWLPEMVTLP